MLAVRRLAVGAVEVVGRIRYVAIGGTLVGLPSSPAAEGGPARVERPSDRREPLMTSVVESPLGLGVPEAVLLGDELLDAVQDWLLVHEADYRAVICDR